MVVRSRAHARLCPPLIATRAALQFNAFKPCHGAMSPNRRAKELDRSAALARRKRRRRTLIRDAVFALTIALILFGAWKAIALAFALGTP
jgi:hypothetical protein